jgi:uncharacterized membrane protein YgcG
VAEFHPWHIHGHSFWVVGSGVGSYDESLVNTTSYNLVNPLLRDSVTLWPLQWVALRFVADNPGVWFFHCHITSHLVMGMGFNMVVSPDAIDEPSESVTSCGEQDLQAGSGESDTGNSSSSGTGSTGTGSSGTGSSGTGSSGTGGSSGCFKTDVFSVGIFTTTAAVLFSAFMW